MIFNQLRSILSGTLRRQLIWGVVGVHALMMSLFVWDLTMRQQEMLQDQQASLATGLAESMATSTALSVVSRDLAGLQEVVEAQQRLDELSYAMILNQQGQVLAHTDRQYLGKYVLDLPVQAALQVHRYSPTQVDVVNPVMVAGRHAGWVRVGFGKSATHVQLERIVRDGVLYALVAIVIGGMLAALMAARLTRRLNRIQSVANAVQSGQSDKRVQMEGGDEAAQLGKQFDAMLEVLAEREHEIFASREKLELTQYAIDHIQEGVFWIDKTGILVNVNEHACTSLGYTGDELVGMHIGDIDSEFDSASWMQSFARKKTESHHVMETRHRHKNGTIFPVEIFSSYVCYGNQEYTFAISRDITARKQEEEILLKSYREIEDLYHNAPCGYHSLDNAGVFLKINDTELSWLGYTREEIVGRKRFADLLTPSSIKFFNQKFPAFMQRGWVNDLEFELVRKDGTVMPVLLSATAVRDDAGNYLMSRTTIFDIAERKQAEFALENLNRFYSLLTHVNEAIVRATNQNQLFKDICRIAVEDGRFVMAWVGMMDNDLHEINPLSYWGHEAGYLEYLRKVGILSYSGPTAQTLQTGVCRLSQDIAGDAAMSPWRQEALKRGYRSSAAFPLYLGSKVVGAINLYAADAHYFDDAIVCLLDDLARDISFALGALDQQGRRAHAEAQLQQLNRELEQRVADRTRELENTNKELESFSYSVSHDLRAPLRSIDGFSQLLLKRYSEHLDATGKDYLERVRRASQHMGQLIDDLLQLSKVTRGSLKREQIDLGKIAEKVADDLKNTNPGRVVRFVLQQNLSIFADGGLMHIVMENLLGNAYKYTAKKPAAEIEFGMHNTNGENVFFVRDNGDGFNMEYAHKLFGAFQRLHGASEFEGTGIGLATVQRIIHRHHGNVWAEAKEGKGATFYFTAPQRKREN
ncbi:MAG: hypothetical protein B7Y56_06360 [Gallionellales bacterium 35-53-114]|jgi:PAS domain S-box-containing protein|nr:MAG: hypothetical protein B7Y56_06360 [Gallionellales bacterium 35-53-114]OYZ63818.1 MAG: hypothetical protein B7Y04_07455 [Gallionellales bacterium 24-53-125]OZB09350.1 MAG: hypothetical protein B7X61_06755 [Gallionellales bacterium 39-52-133]HQS57994.1 PAS domain S-box protein [Gallionellaceae bacterium]HQS76155.1 PAS domain S-box protein [Gallionellaceae bacterium]